MRTLTRNNVSFQELFGQPVQLTVRVPGRVNLMGDHTDYNGGYVLPTRIPQETQVEFSLSLNQKVRLFSKDLDESLHEYTLAQEKPTGLWIDYVQGITKILVQEGFPLQGFDALVRSDVPVGSGLSSSAALEIAILRGLRELLNLPLKDLQLAKTGQRAENEFVGAPVGILDQMACLLAKPGEALFINTQDLSYRSIELPAQIEMIVINSGISHRHAEGQYKVRRQECEQAAARLGVNNLSQLTPSDLLKISTLPSPLNRRAKHVITENDRVLATISALRQDDHRLLGRLFYESHESLSRDYEVSVPEIDFLIDRCRREESLIGARMTGGGFGGCIVILAKANEGRRAAQELLAVYRQQMGREAKILVPILP